MHFYTVYLWNYRSSYLNGECFEFWKWYFQTDCRSVAVFRPSWTSRGRRDELGGWALITGYPPISFSCPDEHFEAPKSRPCSLWTYNTYDLLREAETKIADGTSSLFRVGPFLIQIAYDGSTPFERNFSPAGIARSHRAYRHVRRPRTRYTHRHFYTYNNTRIFYVLSYIVHLHDRRPGLSTCAGTSFFP